jgi:D-alanyl-lipoteichoic acid acyltransferase DltB (MBOAT superfamily)
MSYTIDVYRREMRATRDLVNFLAYVSFFPQLVAGPIERARHLLPQFGQTLAITRSMLEEGMWLILWGMFKKVALADNLAPLVELVYGGPAWSAPTVVLATIAFAFQIYCDFSGYSDIARGTAKVLGFDIMVNFDIPYAAISLRDFWRRWHISLSTWLRDYLYIPLGGNRGGRARTFSNLLLTMFLGGLWHGAAWHFVLWGLWHGAGLGVERAVGKFKAQGSNFKVHSLLTWSLTMLFVLYGWLLFRAASLEQVVGMTRALGDFSAPPWITSFGVNLAAFTLPLLLFEAWQMVASDHLAPLRIPIWCRPFIHGALLTGILLFWQKADTPFIYFRF